MYDNDIDDPNNRCMLCPNFLFFFLNFMNGLIEIQKKAFMKLSL